MSIYSSSAANLTQQTIKPRTTSRVSFVHFRDRLSAMENALPPTPIVSQSANMITLIYPKYNRRGESVLLVMAQSKLTVVRGFSMATLSTTLLPCRMTSLSKKALSKTHTAHSDEDPTLTLKLNKFNKLAHPKRKVSPRLSTITTHQIR